ncbi:2-oxoacid:acceptor oxidoreductase subunit alpha [Candidatus Woesearchaeota archaeon]|nr:2-oxoacid:acceptor oxidoreductase subunit alpha [Candidatus Woesearchaeota archaeon]
MRENALCWRAGGQAGDGIMTVGQMFGRVCSRSGLHVCVSAEFPSLIRGGHNSVWVRVGGDSARAPLRGTDLLVALNRESIDRHAASLNPGAAVIFDPDHMEVRQEELPGKLLAPIPLESIARHDAGDKIYRNVVAVGATLGLLDFGRDTFREVLQSLFGRKGPEVIAANLAAAEQGYESGAQFSEQYPHRLRAQPAEKRMLLTGNHAIAMGALAAGCRFYSAYPMTPASELLHFLARVEREQGIVVRQSEDEIAALCMALGASHAGVRAMTGTSGGGFALMGEALSLAGMSETPVVVVVASRPGPSTGMPTWTAQGDLRFAAHAGHGEFPRFVIAPGDVGEAFSCTAHAFGLAEKYQAPAIVLSDRFLSMGWWSQPLFSGEGLVPERGKLADGALLQEMRSSFGRPLRYRESEDGVSPRWFPGTPGGAFSASGNEHDESGDTCDKVENRKRQMDKRLRKMAAAEKDIPPPQLFGDEDAELLLAGFGSTKMPALDALELLSERGIPAAYLHVSYLVPFKAEAVRRIISGRGLVVVEGNADGQLAGMIAEHTGIIARQRILKYDGRPFFPDEIAKEAERIGRTACTS